MARKKKEEVKSDPFDLIISSLEDAAKTKSIFSYKPHAKQQAFHSDPAKVRTLIGGNRSGKLMRVLRKESFGSAASTRIGRFPIRGFRAELLALTLLTVLARFCFLSMQSLSLRLI